MNTVTIELCQADRERLDRILAALQNVGTPYQVVEMRAGKEELVIAPEPEETPKSKEPDVTHNDVQKKVVSMSAAGLKSEVRAIVTEYAEKATSIPADKLPEVMRRLLALEQQKV